MEGERVVTMELSAINELIGASVRIATPITLAALSGVFCQKAGVFNIGLEGIMTVGAFAAAVGVGFSGGSVWVGMLCAILSGLFFSALFAFSVIKLRANQIITGIGLNLLGPGVTSFVLRTVFQTKGTLRPTVMKQIPNIKLSFLSDIPVLGGIFSDQHLLTYIGIMLMMVTAMILYKTPYGMACRAVGELPESVATAGIAPEKIHLKAILWSGAFCGLAGTYLSTVSVSEFTENMVQGRGFTAFTALIFGNADPAFVWLASLLFGFADALGIRLELANIGFSSSIIKMFPYLLSITALTISCIARDRRLKGQAD